MLEARKHLEAVKEEELNELDKTNRTKEDAFFGDFFDNANEAPGQENREDLPKVTEDGQVE